MVSESNDMTGYSIQNNERKNKVFWKKLTRLTVFYILQLSMSKLATGSRELWLENLNYQHQLPYLWSRICKLIGASRKWLICRLQPASFWVNNGFLMKRTKIFHRVPKKGKKSLSVSENCDFDACAVWGSEKKCRLMMLSSS